MASPAEAESLLRDILEALVEFGFFDPQADQPIIRFLHPAELRVSGCVVLDHYFCSFSGGRWDDYITGPEYAATVIKVREGRKSVKNLHVEGHLFDFQIQ